MQLFKLLLLTILTSLSFFTYSQELVYEISYLSYLDAEEAYETSISDDTPIVNALKENKDTIIKKLGSRYKRATLSHYSNKSEYKEIGFFKLVNNEEQSLRPPSNIKTYKVFNDGFSYTNTANGNFICKEKLINLNDWTITSQQKEILGFTATLATKGDIHAWFTEEIPIPDGPSKYNGLPGIILQLQSGMQVYRAYDVQIHKMNKIPFEIPKFEKPFITREKFVMENTNFFIKQRKQ